MRADQGHAALDLLLARLGQRRQQHLVERPRACAPRRCPPARRRTDWYSSAHRAAAGRQLLVRLVRQRLQRRDQVQPLRQQLGARARQVLVPHVEGGQVHRAAAVPAGHRRRLQQGVALLEHPLVVGPHARHPRRAGRDQLVEEAAPLAGVALDQGQVLRREQHRPYDPQHVTRPDLRGPVDPGPVGTARVELQLDQLLPLALRDRGPDDRAVRRPSAPAGRRRRPGGCRASRDSRPPRRDWSCPGRWGPRKR